MHVAGVLAVEQHGTPLPRELIDSIRRNKVALKGPVTTPIGEASRASTSGCERRSTCTRTCAPSGICPACRRASGVDLVIVRENTEDLYAGLEHEVVPGVVESLKIITERASTRIAQFAFEHARRHGRKRVTAIHKANIMKMRAIRRCSPVRASFDYVLLERLAAAARAAKTAYRPGRGQR